MCLICFLLACQEENKEAQQPYISQQAYETGENLFSEYCDACHHKSMIYEMTGPALGYSLEQRDSAWVRYHIKKGSYAAVEDKDSISLTLRARGWGGMTSFDFLTEEEIDGIIFYIKEEFKKNKK
ncbi:MAG: c-type cytochrome [Aureispira sp.]